MAARTRARPNGPTQSSAGLIVGIGAIGAGVATWFALPGAFAFWVAMLVAALLEPPVTLTGPKKNGYPTPANDDEVAKRERAEVWRRLRLTLIVPLAAAPGWPVLGAWLAGVCSAVLFAVLPEHVPAWAVLPGPAASSTRIHYLLVMYVVNAAGAFSVVTAWAEANRRRLGDHPGTRVNSLAALLRAGRRSALVTAATLLAGAGGVVGVVLGAHHFAKPDVVAVLDRYPCFVLVPAALLAAGAATWPRWSGHALAKWRLMNAARAEWDPRWIAVKSDPPPTLADRIPDEEHGVVVDVFDARSHIGAAGMIPLAPKLVPAIGAGRDLVLLSHPMEANGAPQPGTTDPVRFRAVTWDTGAYPDLSDPKLGADIVELAAEFALARVTDAAAYDRMVALAIEPISAEDSPVAAYQSMWTGTHVGSLRLGKKLAAAGAAMGVPVLADHRALAGEGVLYFGAIGHDEITYSDPDMAKRLADIANEDWWSGVWESGSPSRLSANTPTISVPMYAEAALADGTLVKRQPFVTRQGVDPGDYFGCEPKLAASLGAAPYVAVTGWPGPSGRPGDRHPQALCVYWSSAAVPATLDALAPVDGGTVPATDADAGSRTGPRGVRRPSGRQRQSATMATTWVVAGRMNRAFTAAKLARPEVVSAYALSSPASRRHLWKIQLRLHDGVTLDEVRAKAEKLRTDLGVAWLRVVDAPDGAIVVAGADPDHVTLVNPVTDTAWLVSLDWEQAFLDANLTGSGGVLPKLVGVDRLTHNDQVQVVDFSLPSGLSPDRVKGALKKLKGSTGNGFVEVRPSPKGPSSFRLLVSETNPLPERVAFRFDDAASDREKIFFATGIEGEPVAWEVAEMPHLLVAGTTGSGKSILAQNFLWGWAVHGGLVCVVDPQKQAADFQFLTEHAYGFAVDVLEAAAMMKAVYAEARKRMELNARYKVGNYLDLPESVRPNRILVFIDEFTSLMGKDTVPPDSDDPEESRERDLVIATNTARATIGVFAGKLGREARSAGVHLALGTQKLNAKVLDTIPGSSDLKTNLARTLLGNASYGDKQSALRAPDETPEIDAFPKGRGLWEPLNLPGSVAVQTWYAPQPELARELAARVPRLDEADRLDFTSYLAKKTDDGGDFGPPPGWDADPLDTPEIVPVPVEEGEGVKAEVEEIDLGDVDFDLGDLDFELDGDPSPDSEPDADAEPEDGAGTVDAPEDEPEPDAVAEELEDEPETDEPDEAPAAVAAVPPAVVPVPKPSRQSAAPAPVDGGFDDDDWLDAPAPAPANQKKDDEWLVPQRSGSATVSRRSALDEDDPFAF